MPPKRPRSRDHAEPGHTEPRSWCAPAAATQTLKPTGQACLAQRGEASLVCRADDPAPSRAAVTSPRSEPSGAQPTRRRAGPLQGTSWLRAGLLMAVAYLGGLSTQLGVAHASGEQDSPYHLLGQLARVLVLIENQYVEPVDRVRLLQGGIKGMVAELDPHSAYLPAQDYQQFQSDTEGRFGGVGVEIEFRDEQLVVLAPIEDSPAARAGILPGDRIVSIDGREVRGRPTDDLVKQMRGAPGTQLTLGIKREGRATPLSFTLTREVIQVKSVSHALLDGQVAYLRVKAFQSGTHAELLRAIGALRSEAGGPLSKVILDLRNNPGGLVDESSAVADEFLGGGTIYSVRHRGKVVSEVRAAPGGALRSGSMVVLVNEYSASAAELVAGALQDQRRATVVGADTFGKGSVQSILSLPGGAGLRLTTMRYYTPNGQAIQARGVKPDVLVQALRAGATPGVVREADLPNHLPAEGAPGSRKSPDKPSQAPAPEEDPGTYLGVARVVPKDPTGGPDVALSIGYQIVTGVLSGR